MNGYDKQVLKLRNQGKTYKEIIKLLNISKGTVRNILVRNNFPMETEKYAHKFDFYKDKIPDIINDYINNNIGCDLLATKYALSQSTIYKILQSNSITIRDQITNAKIASSRYRKEIFNIEFFKVNSNELAYMMGFALADGHFHFTKTKVSGRLSFNIHKNDLCILQKFCDWLHISYDNIKLYRQKYIRLNLRHCELFNLINKWGIVPRKTYEPIEFDIPTEYIKPFITGFMDGDGHYRCDKNGYAISFVANKKITKLLYNFLSKIGLNKNFIKERKSDVWNEYRITNKCDAMTFISILEPWNFSNLSRKWGKYQELCQKI